MTKIAARHNTNKASNKAMSLEKVRKAYSKSPGLIYVTRDGAGGFIVYIETEAVRKQVESTAASLPFNFSIVVVNESEN